MKQDHNSTGQELAIEWAATGLYVPMPALLLALLAACAEVDPTQFWEDFNQAVVFTSCGHGGLRWGVADQSARTAAA